MLLILLRSAGSGTNALTATGISTGAPTVGTPALGQIVDLSAVGIATGAPTVGTPAIGQVHDLAAVGIDTGAPTVGSPAVMDFGVDALDANGISTGTPTVGTPAIEVFERTGGGGGPQKDDWWRSSPGKKKRRKATDTDTGAPIEEPLSVSAAEEARRVLEDVRQRELAAQAAIAADAEIERQRRMAIMADDELILLLAA